jgi:hypothetical protein
MIYLFDHSLKVWSRILAYEAGMMTELRLTPLNPKLDWTWEQMVNPIDIRHVHGHLSTRDRVTRALMLIEGDVLSLVDWPRYQEITRRTGRLMGRLLTEGGFPQLIALAACREKGHTYPIEIPRGPRTDECKRCHSVREVHANGDRTYTYKLAKPRQLPDTCCALVEPRRNWCASCTDNDGDPNFCSNVDREEER